MIKGSYYVERYVNALMESGILKEDTQDVRNKIIASCYVSQHGCSADSLVRNIHAYGTTVESFSISMEALCKYIVHMCEQLELSIEEFKSVETINLNDTSRTCGEEILKNAVHLYKRRYTYRGKV